MELNANRNLLKTFNEFGRHHLPMHFQLSKNKKLELLVPYGLKKWLVTNSSCEKFERDPNKNDVSVLKVLFCMPTISLNCH